jgi:pimeloyl-ACP methyl ester carboxylesterase
MAESHGFRSDAVAVSGCRVGLLRGGTGDPLLYLHGAEGAGRVEPFMAALAENYDVLVPEHPGFGVSDQPDWLDNIHDVAYFYLDFLRALDLVGVHLVGQSLGGWVALEMAVRSTERIQTLTLASPAGIHVSGLRTGDPFAWSPEETLRQVFHDPLLAEEAIAGLPENVEGDDTFLKNRSTFARLAWEPRLHDPHLHKWLHRVDVPTRIVWGEDDQVLSVAYADEIARRIPGAQVTIVPKCGHLVPVEKAAEFVSAIDHHIGQATR